MGKKPYPLSYRQICSGLNRTMAYPDTWVDLGSNATSSDLGTVSTVDVPVLIGKQDGSVKAKRMRRNHQRRADEAMGKRPRFIPLSERNKASEPEPELPRYVVPAVDRSSKLRFAGRGKLKVKGFGPWA